VKKLFYILISIALFSCKKDPVTVDPIPVVTNYETNDVNVDITNMSNNQILQISKDTVYSGFTPKYINANGDTFSVTTFKYYVSNFKLKRADGTYFIEKDSYRLISLVDTTNYCKFALKNVPYGDYVSMEYLIGVDSAANCSGAQAGCLAQSGDMFWSWNQGYIFLKFEGYSSSSSPSNIHNIEYHVGGFKLPYNNIKKITIPFTSGSLTVGNNVPEIYLKADIQKCFTNSTYSISFSTTQIVTSPSSAKLIANNYADMFSLAAIVN